MIRAVHQVVGESGEHGLVVRVLTNEPRKIGFENGVKDRHSCVTSLGDELGKL